MWIIQKRYEIPIKYSENSVELRKEFCYDRNYQSSFKEIKIGIRRGENMEIVKKQDTAFQVFFNEQNQKNPHLQMGMITLQPGERSPKEGFACHEQDEYSYVVFGKARTVLETGEDKLGLPGDAQWIEAQEKHWNYNDGDEPAVVVWMLVER